MRTTLALLFFLSGLSSLVLQTVWTRLMVLAFGSTTFAVSTVLTAFMGGLALGSALAGRTAVRIVPTRRRGVQIYAALELCIGLYALALPFIADALPAIHRAIWGEGGGSYYVFALLRFVIAALCLLLPTVAMGATLPVLAHVYCEGRDPEITGRRVGTLYAINTAGAVVGVLLAGFVLLPSVGLTTTNAIACGADVLLAALALLLARRFDAHTPIAHDDLSARPSAARDGASGAAEPFDADPAARRLALVALASVAVSGAMAMAYEVAWTRALSLVIGSSTYAFSLILACVLVGLAGGAALYARRQTSARDQAQNLSLAHLLAALTAAAGVALLDDLPAVMLVALKKLTLTPGSAFVLKFALCAVVVLLPSFFFGMVFPAVVRAYAALRRAPSRTTGAVYAVNTVGAIVGAFAAGFALVPALGLQATLMLLVATGIALAGAFGLLASTRRRRLTLAIVCFAALLGTLGSWRRWNLQALSSGVFRVSRYADVVKTLGGARAKHAKHAKHAKVAESPTPRLRRRWRALALRLVPPADVVDTFREPTAGSALVSHVEGVTTTVGISRSVDASLSGAACWVRHALLVNGKPDASLSLLFARPKPGCGLLLRRDAKLLRPLAVSPSGDMETQLLSGLLPRLLGGARASQRALVIGWGSGITVHALLANSSLDVTAVELEREVVRSVAAPFSPLAAPVDSKRLSIVAEDGRNYLAATRERFAMVVSEPSNPWMAGCGNLFTHEFFRAVRARLVPGGVLLQWLQAYEIAPRNVASILATLHSVFDDVLVFGPVQSSADMLLVARTGASPARRGRLHWPTLATRFEALRDVRIAGVRALALLGIVDPADIVVRVHAGSAGVAKVARGAPLNTDDNARIEFAAPRDLIEYRRYSPRAIVRQLRRAGGPAAAATATASVPGAALVDDKPSDLARRLCWARLRAGDSLGVEADALGAARASFGARCVAAAELLAKVAPPTRADVTALLGDAARGGSRFERAWAALSKPRDSALAELEAIFDIADARQHHAALSLMGHLEAMAGNAFEALLYISAAAHAPSARRYRALATVRAATLARVGQHTAAVRAARALVAPRGP
ncbi:MAG: fused MFS/spermidine synthase [Myxococcales bacterium]|nr:fused MFS/spermidine synthase [Myxococcales bacterium]